MTYQQDLGIQHKPTGWTGWVMFAACVLIVNGLFGVVEGLTGIFRDAAFFAGGKLLVFDYTTWGWIHLLLGILLLAVGAGLWRGSPLARMVAIGLVMLNLLAQFVWTIASFPWWSVIAISLDIVILYALIVHGDENTRSA